MDEIRKNILRHYSDHIASSFSCVEILDALYGITCKGIMGKDDTFILSKGHAAPALYTILCMKGVLKWEDLPKYGLHCDHRADGVPFTTGSLGCGLGLGIGLSLARRLNGDNSGRTYVLCGDGELYEGSMWEALRFAGENNIINITLLVDRNGKSTYKNTKIPHTIPGWKCYDFVLGEDLEGQWWPQSQKKPTLLLFDTLKGNGIKELEDDPLCHVRKVTPELKEKYL